MPIIQGLIVDIFPKRNKQKANQTGDHKCSSSVQNVAIKKSGNFFFGLKRPKWWGSKLNKPDGTPWFNHGRIRTVTLGGIFEIWLFLLEIMLNINPTHEKMIEPFENNEGQRGRGSRKEETEISRGWSCGTFH